MRHGFRLRDAGDLHPWRDVFVVVRCAQPGSPIAAALDKRMSWTIDQILAANQVDQLNLLLWSLGGGKGRQPKPLPRPWDVDDRDVQVFKGNPMTTAHALELRDRFRAGTLASA